MECGPAEQGDVILPLRRVQEYGIAGAVCRGQGRQRTGGGMGADDRDAMISIALPRKAFRTRMYVIMTVPHDVIVQEGADP